jgi:hypothetical protein
MAHPDRGRVVSRIDALLERLLTLARQHWRAMSRAQVEYGGHGAQHRIRARPWLRPLHPAPRWYLRCGPGRRSIAVRRSLDDALAECGRLCVSVGRHRTRVRLVGCSSAFSEVLIGVLVIGLAASRDGGDATGKGADPIATIEKNLPDDVRELTAGALKGDRNAIAQLEARPESKRTSAEWRALGRGYTVIGNRKAGLTAYAKALDLDPPIAKDKQLASDVRRAATDPATSDQALALALVTSARRRDLITTSTWSFNGGRSKTQWGQ